jgi:hypothetical protein
MRFYHNNWWQAILSAIEENSRALYCCQCTALDSKGMLIPNKQHFGAFVELYDPKSNSTLSATWIRKDKCPNETKVTIPCVLGASYAADKSYWTYLKGLSGLRIYGSDEPYISIKTWLEGGKCILLKDIEVGHLFRETFPYSVNDAEVLFNKLLIAETLLPVEYKDNAYNILRNANGILLRDAMELLLNRQEEIQELKAYCQKIFTKNFESFALFNNQFKP